MNRQLVLTGLAGLCAIALTAFAAPGASASEATGYTCVEGGTKGFFDSHCKETFASGAFGHVAIPANTNTELTTKAVGNVVFESTIGGASFGLVASGVECEGCVVENSGSTGSMSLSGKGGMLRFTGVVVSKQEANCAVISSPNTLFEPEQEGVVVTEPMRFESTATNELKIAPFVLPDLATFNIVTKAGKKCVFAGGGPYHIEGDFSAAVNGATLSINLKPSLTLRLGVASAGLHGELTIEAGLVGGTHHPLAMT